MAKKKRYRGHWCRLCHRIRPNERFSGYGHKVHLCKDCSRLPKAQIQEADERREVEGFLSQTVISEKNRKRLTVLMASSQPSTARIAAVVLEIAKLFPSRRRRVKLLARTRRDLLECLGREGLMLWLPDEVYEHAAEVDNAGDDDVIEDETEGRWDALWDEVTAGGNSAGDDEECPF